MKRWNTADPARGCAAWRELASARYDGEVLGPQEVEELEGHTQTCSACRDFDRSLAGISERMLADLTPPAPELFARIERALPVPTRRPRVWLRAAALVAGFLSVTLLQRAPSEGARAPDVSNLLTHAGRALAPDAGLDRLPEQLLLAELHASPRPR